MSDPHELNQDYLAKFEAWKRARDTFFEAWQAVPVVEGTMEPDLALAERLEGARVKMDDAYNDYREVERDVIAAIRGGA